MAKPKAAQQTLEERLKCLESTVNRLVDEQSHYDLLKELVDSIPSLLKLDTSLKVFQKKTKELEDKLKGNLQVIEESKDLIKSYDNRAQAAIKTATAIRDKESSLLNHRMNTVENSFKQLDLESQMAVKTMEVGLKEEVCSVMQNIEEKLEAQRNNVTQSLKQTQEELKQHASLYNSSSETTSKDLSDFETTHADRIKKLKEEGKALDPSAKRDKETIKNWLIDQVNSKLTTAVSECSAHYDRNYQVLDTQYAEELAHIRSDLDQLKESFNQRPSLTHEPRQEAGNPKITIKPSAGQEEDSMEFESDEEYDAD